MSYPETSTELFERAHVLHTQGRHALAQAVEVQAHEALELENIDAQADADLRRALAEQGLTYC